MESVPIRGQVGPLAPSEDTSLSEVLLASRPRGFDTLAVLPSNVRAIETGLLFAGGLISHGAIIGPSGWGKSHLLEAVAYRIGVERGPRYCELWSAMDWLHASRNRSGAACLLLDNVQDVIAKTRSRQNLRLALERRVKAGWPTLLAFTDQKITRPIRSLLPNTRNWSLTLLKAADRIERETVVGQMADSEGVLIAPDLRRILAHRLEGNGRTLLGALKRLRLNDTKWIDPPDVLRACGILNPFFSANSAWDLRDHVFDLAREMPLPETATSRQDLAAYTMLRVAQLSEVDVARYFALEPGRAYTVAQRVESVLRANREAESAARQFVERIVATLQPA